MKTVLGISTAALAMAICAPAAAEDPTPADSGQQSDIVVTGEKLKEAPQAGKSDVPLIETPQAISIVSAADLQDRGVTRLAEALRSVAGVSRSSTYGFYDSYQIRGFDAAYGSVYLDGLLQTNVAGSNNELAGLEQVEVVKGPASMLFGSAPLGGIVNLVSKRPQPDAFLDVGLATGSYNLMESSLDLNAPLTSDGALLGRLNVVVRDSDAFVRFAGQNRIFVAPALTWKIGSDTDLTLLGRYQGDHDSPWSPISAWGTVLPWKYGKLPIDFSINNRAPKTHQDQETAQIGYIFNHRFSDALSFTQTARYSDMRTNWRNWIFWAGFCDGDDVSDCKKPGQVIDGVQQGHIAGRYVYGPFHETDRNAQIDSRFTLKAATGAVRHDIMVGLDYRHSRNDYHDAGGNFDPSANPLDLLDPDYSAPFVYDPSGAYEGHDRAHQTGIYAQDHVSFGDIATLTLGGRYDWAESDGQKDEKFSPRIGATVNVAHGAALYASWSRSFVPQNGYLTFTGDPLPPETGRNLEAGLKLQTADGKVSGMASVFDLVRQNVATTDPVHPQFSVVTGEQRSRGVEIEGVWHPTPAATLSLAYAYLDAKVTKDEVFVVGAPLQNVPRNSVNLYGEYVLPNGPAKGLGLSLAFQYNSRKNGNLYIEDVDGDGVPDPISLFTLPAYSLFDAGLSYQLGPWTARLNVNNLFDKRYFPDSCCVDRVTPGEPRNWRLSLSRRF
jgi:iron complex outermembrane receptor protein